MIDEARNEVGFALKELEEELNHAVDSNKRPMCAVADWMRSELDKSLKSVCQELNKQLVPETIKRNRKRSRWQKPNSAGPASRLARVWKKDKLGHDLAQGLIEQWDTGARIGLDGKVNDSWKTFDDKLATLSADSNRDLKYLFLGHQYKMVREYTDMWTIYCMGWAQRPGQALEQPVSVAIDIVDRIADKLYATIQDMSCCTYVQKQNLIPVFYENEAYTRPSRKSPAPFIVVPRWTLRQPWLGSGIAHEVAHNVLWNVQGLFDELLVVLSVELAAAGFSYDRQRVWGRWMEEIFADMFAVLQFGPTAVSSLQRALAYVPVPLLKELDIGLLDDVIDGLRGAYDAKHPVAYLRGWLSLEALEMLIASQEPNQPNDIRDSQVTELKETWREFFQEESEEEKEPQGEVRLMAEGASLGIGHAPAKTMLDQGKIVLDAILYTPLQALAEEGSGAPRSMVDVFYHERDYAKIKDATDLLLLPKSQFSADSFRDMDVRTVLAAAEYAFEQVTFEQATKAPKEPEEQVDLHLLAGHIFGAVSAILPDVPKR